MIRSDVFSGYQCVNSVEASADSPPAPPHRFNSSVCQSVNGAVYLEGQSWSLDACTHCVCRSGRVLCSAPQCPPAACAQPRRPDGGCCAVCPPDVSPLAPGGRSCQVEGGAVKRSGDTWSSGVCQSCRCDDGVSRCFHQRCPALDCQRPLLMKGQCCPQCIGEGIRRVGLTQS